MRFLKNRRKAAYVIGALCVAILGGILIINNLAKHKPVIDQVKVINKYDAATLLKYKSAYVGNNSKVVNLLDNLPRPGIRTKVSFETESKPYGITAYYGLAVSSLSTEAIKTIFRRSATIVFALIDNVDIITFKSDVANTGFKEEKFRFTRQKIQKGYDKDLREYTKDIKSFETLLSSFE